MRIKLSKGGDSGYEQLQLDARLKAPQTCMALRNQHNTVNIAFFYLFRFANIATDSSYEHGKQRFR